jgi:hypothetical protein
MNRQHEKAPKISRVGAVAFMAALVTANVLTPAALAEQPIATTTSFDRTFTTDCPQNFTLIEHYSGTQTIRRFSDGGQQTQVKLNSEFTNSVSGETLQSFEPFMITFGPGTIYEVGVVFRVNKPGEGIIALDAGREVYDSTTGLAVFDKGPSDSSPNLCVVLAD